MTFGRDLARSLSDREKFVFSDYRYTEMVLDLEPIVDPISLKSEPMVILRPEGDWDRPGILKFSSVRMPRKPIENSVIRLVDGATGMMSNQSQGTPMPCSICWQLSSRVYSRCRFLIHLTG